MNFWPIFKKHRTKVRYFIMHGFSYQFFWLHMNCCRRASFLVLMISYPKQYGICRSGLQRMQQGLPWSRHFLLPWKGRYRCGLLKDHTCAPTIYNNFHSMEEFKEDMHHVYICTWKDSEQSLVTLLFLTIDDSTYVVLAIWPLEWCTPDKAILDRLTA